MPERILDIVAYRAEMNDEDLGSEIQSEITDKLESLAEKNRQLLRANRDMKNLLESTGLAALFLDSNLHVRLFTPLFSQLYGLRDGDIGREIADFSTRVTYTELREDAEKVMSDLQPIDREVRVAATDETYAVKVLPYRAVDDRLDGVVITFSDITERKRSELQLEENAKVLREQYAELEVLYDSIPVGLCLQDSELRYLRINPELAAINGYSVEEHIGKRQDELIPDIDQKIKDVQLQVLATGASVLGIEVRGETPKEPGKEREWVVDYYPVKDNHKTFAVGTCVREVTAERRLQREKALAEARAEESKAQMERLFDGTPAFMAVHEGPEHAYIYSNPKHDEIVGHRDIIGKPLREAFPELEGSDILKTFDRVFETGKPVTRPEFEATPIGEDGQDRVVFHNQVLQPWFHEDGSVGGVMSFAFDVTEQHEANAAVELANTKLKESEERMARLLDQAPAVISIFEGPDQTYLYTNTLHDQTVGRDDLIGKPLREAMPELEGQGVIEKFFEVYESGEPLVTDELSASLGKNDGRTTYFQQIIQPWFREDGEVGGTMSFNYDVTELVEAREALRATTSRLASIQDSLQSFVGLLTPDGTLLEANERALVAASISRDDVIGKKFWDCFWWNYSPALQKQLEIWIAQAAKGEHVREECEIRVVGDHKITIDFQLVPSFDEDGNVNEIVPSGIDVTEWRAAEAHKDILLAELQHRVKNVLATVQAIARMSARHTETQEALVTALSQRLAAISRTHDALTRTDWGGQSLHEIVTGEVSPYVEAIDDRLVFKGDDVIADASDALSLSLAFHELATNAAKHGALSNEDGRVVVTIDSTDGKLSMIDWEEQGGPSVTPPTRSGFGSFLLNNILPEDLDAEVQLSYKEKGVQCRIEIDINAG